MEINYCLSCMEKLPAGESSCPYCGYDSQTTQPELNAMRPGSIIRGRYLVGRVLGQGGFGMTYVGQDLVLDAKVAIKEYFPSGIVSRNHTQSNHLRWDTRKGMITQSAGCEDFLKEARKMAKLEKIPSIVQVKDMFLENETAYIVMEYVEGENLRDHLLKTGVLEMEECLNLLEPMIRDLDQVHKHNLIHRDISPDNIMLRSDGSICLLDLGAAKDLSIQKGQSSMVIAKGGFSPLEQYSAGSQIGPWTDVYALCATIYYCLTGKVLPTAIDRMEDETLPFIGLKAPLSPAYRAVLEQGLAVPTKNRIQSAAELLEKLDQARKGHKPKAKTRKKGGAGKWIAAMFAAVLAVAGLWGGWLIAQAPTEPPQVQTAPAPSEAPAAPAAPVEAPAAEVPATEGPATEPPAEVPAEAPAETQPAYTLPADITGTVGGALNEERMEVLIQGILEYWETGHWKTVDKKGGEFRVNAAAYYVMKNLEGFDVEVLLVQIDGVDYRMYGNTSNILVIDVKTGDMYYDRTLDYNNWGQFATIEHAYALCGASYPRVLFGLSYWVWSEMEDLTHFSPSELQEVNDLLAQRMHK